MSAVSAPVIVDSDLVNPDPRVITVWSDLGCPWASLALRTLHTRARERQEQLLIDHRAFPLELFNSRPTPRGIVDVEIAALAGQRTELGWHEWAAEDSTYPVTMLPAMEAVQACKAPEVGGLAASDQLDAALRHAFYVESRCISMPSVILEIAATCDQVSSHHLARALRSGIARSALYEQWTVAQRPEVDGSPHLLLANGLTTHNPGADYHWTAAPPRGVVVLDDYNSGWTDAILDLVV